MPVSSAATPERHEPARRDRAQWRTTLVSALSVYPARASRSCCCSASRRGCRWRCRARRCACGWPTAASISAPSVCCRWRACPTPSSSCGRRWSMRSTCRGCRRGSGGGAAGWSPRSSLLMAAILFLGTRDPVAAPLMVGLGALLVAFASATQDIVIDAYRVESLSVDEQAAGMAGYVAAYRIGMLVSGAGVIGLTAWLEAQGLDKTAVWPIAYAVAAAAGAGGAAGRAARARAERRSRRCRAGGQVGCAGARGRARPATRSPISCRAMRRSPCWRSSCSTSCAMRWPAP